MKKLFFIALTIILYNLSYAQIKMNSSGNVGIGVNPSSYKLNTTSGYFTGNVDFYLGYVGLQIRNIANGTVLHPSLNNTTYIGYSNKRFYRIYCYDLDESSDVRQKENIRDIPNALELILKLKGVKYDLKKEYAYNDTLIKDENLKAKLEFERKNQFGFLAQDVNKIIPEVVSYDDSTDSYGLYYTRIIPILTEAIKEQQSHIEILQAEIEQLKIGDSRPKSTAENNLGDAQLFQNQPNPFYENTVIDYYIPDGNQKATIYVYDLNGSQKKAYDVTTEGRSKIVINSSELQPGMYLYTLIVGGKEVDTKRMILTD